MTNILLSVTKHHSKDNTNYEYSGSQSKINAQFQFKKMWTENDPKCTYVGKGEVMLWIIYHSQHHLPQRPKREKAGQHEEETRITLKNRLGSRTHTHTCVGEKLRPWNPLISPSTIPHLNKINNSLPSSSSFSSWPPALWDYSSRRCWSSQPGTECFQWSSADLLAFLPTRRRQNGVNIMFPFSLPVNKCVHGANSIPLAVMSWLLRAPWIISCASVFLTFKMSMVSFSSVSSESSRGENVKKNDVSGRKLNQAGSFVSKNICWLSTRAGGCAEQLTTTYSAISIKLNDQYWISMTKYLTF